MKRFLLFFLLSTVACLPALNSREPAYSSYRRPPGWKVRLFLEPRVHEFLNDFSLSREKSPEPASYMETAMLIRDVLIAFQSGRMSDGHPYFNDSCDIIRGIEDESDAIWLLFYGKMLTERWICHTIEDAKVKDEMTGWFENTIDDYGPDKVRDMALSAPAKSEYLTIYWIVHQTFHSFDFDDSMHSCFAEVVYSSLDYLRKHDKITDTELFDIALKSRIPGYDGTQTTLDHRYVNVILRWGDNKTNSDLLTTIAENFEPTNKNKIFTNLRVITTILRYGYKDFVADILLRGNPSTPSLLLETALAYFPVCEFTRQFELARRIHDLQSFVFPTHINNSSPKNQRIPAPL